MRNANSLTEVLSSRVLLNSGEGKLGSFCKSISGFTICIVSLLSPVDSSPIPKFNQEAYHVRD